MKLRVRLILAFLLLSVVPLGAVTIYSYVANYRALQAAATREADQLAAELSQRMQLVTTQLSARVEQLMDVPAVDTKAAKSGKPAEPAEPAEPAPMIAEADAADALGAAAMLLNSVELRGLRTFGSRGRGGRDGSFVGPRIEDADPNRARTFGGGPNVPTPPPNLMPPPRRAGQPGESPEPPAPGSPDRRQRFVPPPPGAPPQAPPAGSMDEVDRIQIDVGSIARDIVRQLGVPTGPNTPELTSEQRQRVAAEINQRMLGITEGLRIAAAKLQERADAARKKAEADAKIAAVKAEETRTATAPLKRRTALTGNKLNVTIEQNGKVVRTANAEVNLPNVLMTVFASMPRGQGEVPFAVGRDGQIYTPTSANRALLEPLDPADLPNGASMFREWVIVMTPDPTGSGLRLGIARPVGDSLNELRRTAGRNAGLGLLFIGLSIVLIVPLSGRLTRNLSALTGAVKQIAHGDYGARVRVKSKDEVGELGAAFNQMAADVETHQRAAIGQERLKRELELGRQIQHDMQPQAPLRLGFTEIQGVSVPAREVGGDFFNYFALPDGHVALVVGDVSGKGVGAALLMANTQASLRTRFALGQDLSAIVDAIDRDIEVNSPGQMYATLFVGVLDPKARLLRYVNAGHHPQYVLRKGGGLERMGATGLPAGLLAGRGYVEKRVQLDADDLIFFYTDGCPETENEQEEMFGAEQLEALLVAAGLSTPDDVLQRVEAALKGFRGSREPFDDATMMAVRVG